MAVLEGLAAQAGMRLIEKVLTGKLGEDGGTLAADVLARLAERAGVLPEKLEEVAEQSPGRVIDAMRQVEPVVPELAAYEVEMFRARLAAEETEPYWMRAWRPGGMYLIGFLWLWQVVLLHVANAIWKIALPPAPWDVLLGLSGLYFSLYMGGHTIKDVIGKWAGVPK